MKEAKKYMYEKAESITKEILGMLQDNYVLAKAAAFVDATPDLWIPGMVTGTDQSFIDISINFNKAHQEDQSYSPTETWFQCNMGSMAASQVSIRVFPSRNNADITWWHEGELRKQETISLEDNRRTV